MHTDQMGRVRWQLNEICVNPSIRVYLRELLMLLVCCCTMAAGQQVPASASASEPSSLQDAKSLIDAGKFDDAIAKLTELERADPQVKGVERQLGIAYYRKGDFAGAQAAFAKAMAEDPNDREAIQLRGLSLFQLGRPAEAIPYLKQMQSWVGSVNVDANYVLGLCYIRTEKYDEARRSFAQLYGVAPDSAA